MSDSSRSSSSDDEMRIAAVYDSIHAVQASHRYKFLEMIGKGTYGDIMKLYDVKSGTLKAAKVIIPQNASEEEMVHWAKLKHRNITSADEVSVLKDGTLIIVMPYQFKPLDEVLGDMSFVNHCRAFDWTRKWLHDVLKGVEYMHGKQVCHLDLKLDNVLIGNDGVATICDFSFANDGASDLSIDDIGVPKLYRPPELFVKRKNRQRSISGTKVDCWTYGILVLEAITDDCLLTHVRAYNHWRNDIKPLLKLFLRQRIFEVLLTDCFPKFEFTQDVKNCTLDFIDRFLRVQPEERISARSSLRHEFFDHVEKVQVHLHHIYSHKELFPNLQAEHRMRKCVYKKFAGKASIVDLSAVPLKPSLSQAKVVRSLGAFISFRQPSITDISKISKPQKDASVRKLKEHLKSMTVPLMEQCIKLCQVVHPAELGSPKKSQKRSRVLGTKMDSSSCRESPMDLCHDDDQLYDVLSMSP